MGKTVLQKLRSRKGASLTFALLAFLVCAVISAVLLASASASAGRGAEIAQMDQRYYAVTSAAQLISDAIQDQCKFGIRRQAIHEETWETDYYYDANLGSYVHNDATLVGNDDGRPTNQYNVKFYAGKPTDTESEISFTGISDSTRNQSIWSEIALYYIFGEQIYSANEDYQGTLAGVTFQTPAAGSKYHTIVSTRYSTTWNMSMEMAGYDYLTVDVSITLDQHGDLLIKVTNCDADKAFTVVEKLAAEVQEDAVEDGDTKWSSTIPSDEFAEYKTKEVSKTEQSVTTWITWTVLEVKKGTANEA